MTTIYTTRYHDISCGHRVVGHEGKCLHLHGHNYRIHFRCEAEHLDSVGRVIDFGVIKSKLCMWLEQNWDHKFIAWSQDRLVNFIVKMVEKQILHTERVAIPDEEDLVVLRNSIVWVPFNPTAENLALYLLKHAGPAQLQGTGVRLTSVLVEETMKCAAGVEQ